MKTLQDIRLEQRAEVNQYRRIAEEATNHFCLPNASIVGALLSGSSARGDARLGPFGFMIDLIVVVENRTSIDLEKVFGPDREPTIPYHCISFRGLGLQIELATLEELKNIRTATEAEIFAKQEAIVLLDKTGQLAEWKHAAFTIAPEQKRDRALPYFFRFQYLTNEYHQEKWTNREAWIQLVQNANEACECYCSFIYCANGWFIPRKDWLVFLTYDLKEKVEDREFLIEEAYRSDLTKEGCVRRYQSLGVIGEWMKQYCRQQKWIDW